MEMLRKEEVVFANDGTKPLPILVELLEILPGEKEKRQIKMVPALPEEWSGLAEKGKEMALKNEDFDGWLIVKYIEEPKLSLNDVKFMKLKEKSIIARTILAESGFPIKEVMAVAGVNEQEPKEEKTENSVLQGQGL